METKEKKNIIEGRNAPVKDAGLEETSNINKKLPMSKVFDLKIVPSMSEDSPNSSHSFCTSCKR